MDTKFRTFWRRYWALVIDTLLLLPIAILLFAYGSQVTAPAAQIVLHFIGSFYGVIYSVVLHSRYGQTIGKMAARIKVVDLAEGAIGIRQAMWRDGPTILICIATAA